MKWKIVTREIARYANSAAQPPAYEATVRLEGETPGEGVTLANLQSFLQTCVAKGIPATALLGDDFEANLRWS